MSALDLAQISACLASLSNPRHGIASLPSSLIAHILSYCDVPSQLAAARASKRFAVALIELRDEEAVRRIGLDWNDNMALGLDLLPADVLLTLFKFFSRQDLGRMAQVCSRFRALCYSDCLWIDNAREALASNQRDQGVRARSQEQLRARDKVRVGRCWGLGLAKESPVAVMSSKYMPRLQLESKRLWVSWGNKIWCHPRTPGGGVSKTSSRVLRAHSDDVSKFVVEEGMVVSGGRDRSLCAWSSSSGEFLFARRYCHGGEITAVDVTAHGSVIVTGSRDRNVLVWAVQPDPAHDSLLPVLAWRHEVGDRVWSVSVSPHSSVLAVGTAATRTVPPLRLYDLISGEHLLDLGTQLKNGAGMLDLAWLSPHTLLACGYDTFTRLWDTRCREAVRAWEEEYDESVYCLATDKLNCLVTGTSRHGRVRVWDMRCQNHLYMRHATPARRGQSSPVYSMAMDASNLYVALDQSLNHFGFGGGIGEEKRRSNRRAGENKRMIRNNHQGYNNRNQLHSARW